MAAIKARSSAEATQLIGQPLNTGRFVKGYVISKGGNGNADFYRQDQGGQVEFTGESTIDTRRRTLLICVVTGNAFDITGERKQTDFHVDSAGRTVDESFEIKVKNVKETAVKVSVVEHLYRWSNWSISSASAQHTKADSRTIEFPIDVAANGEQAIIYTVHYSW